MLSSDFAASQRRLANRAKAISDRAKQKADKERILAERQQAHLAAIEEEKRQRRLEDLRIQEDERRKHEADLERNNGVFYRAKLRAVPAPDTIATEKGIKRAADKVLLPPSAGASLMSQDAYKNGPMFFELDNGSGRLTHVGLLEFTSAEGFIALPLKVIKCLWGPDATAESCEGVVDVVYRKLPKGERVVFQPRSALFQQTIADDIRTVLETALHQHSVLTERDWIQVQHAGSTWDLRVRELDPEAAVSVIDTDLEAEINPSIETEERIKAEEEEAQRRLESVAQAVLAEAARVQELQEVEMEAEEQAERDRLHRIQIAAEKERLLPPEPAAANDGSGSVTVVSIMFRFPDGRRHSRRFRVHEDVVQTLFDYVQSKGAGGLLPGQYNLVTSFPRRVFQYSDDSSKDGDNKGGGHGGLSRTLEEVGLGGGREVLYLEPVSALKMQ